MARKRKRRGSSFRRTRRRLFRRRARYRNARIRRIARLANEKKYAYYTGLFSTVDNTGTLLAFQIAQGDSISTRDGNRVLLRGMRMRTKFEGGDIIGGSAGNNIRVIVLTSEAPLSASNMPTILGMFHHEYQPRRHRILMDKVVHLPVVDVSGSAATIEFYRKWSFKLRLFQKYTGALATEQASGFLYIWMTSDSSIIPDPGASTDVVLSYRDY